MSNWEQPQNDGWTDVEYEFGLDEQETKRVSYILNEACHLFYYHADGNWNKTYKERYAVELAKEFLKHPELSGRVLRSNDRVVKMVAFRALEILKEQSLTNEKT
jgi:hypothetical protein